LFIYSKVSFIGLLNLCSRYTFWTDYISSRNFCRKMWFMCNYCIFTAIRKARSKFSQTSRKPEKLWLVSHTQFIFLNSFKCRHRQR